MANGHGGYRRPSDPAPVSGPGALSRRTDGGPIQMSVTDLPYGEAGEVNAAQAAAPLSAPGPSRVPPQMPTGLSEPSTMPDQPVTAGADAGAGPSAADIGLKPDEERELRQKLGPRLPVLMRMADAPYATSSYKRSVRQLIARIHQ